MVKRKKAYAVQVAVYDMANNPLPERLIKEVEDAVEHVIKNSGRKETLATTVVTE